MEAQALYVKVRQRSFEPFRLHVSDGKAYEVTHPEQVLVGRRTSHIGMSRNGDGPFQRIAIVSNVHITRVEPIE